MAINRTNVTRLAGTARVSDLLADARALLSTDIDARGFEMRLYGPDGDRINGNTTLQTVRDMEPALRDDGQPLAIFFNLLADVGLDEISFEQAGDLYGRLHEVMGGDDFDKRLLRYTGAP
jgi:hypothetical protein